MLCAKFAVQVPDKGWFVPAVLMPITGPVSDQLIHLAKGSEEPNGSASRVLDWRKNSARYASNVTQVAK